MKSKKKFRYEKTIVSEPEYDLVVAGGGPAGTVAAIAAARAGIRVLLAESTGALGGMGTSGMVSSWYCLGNNVHTIAGGIVTEICSLLYKRNAIDPSAGPEQWTKTKRGFGFDPECLKIILDELCEQAGVEVRFCTRVLDVHASNHRIHGVIIHSSEGLSYLPCLSCIDATGDGTVSQLAGARVLRAGIDTPNIMPPTLCARITGIDYTRFDRRRDQQAAVDQALRERFFSQPDRHIPGLFRTGENEAVLNAGHLFTTDALSTSSLSEGYRKGRLLVQEYMEFFRVYLDGCQDIRVAATASLMGIRESQRVIGEYYLDFKDFSTRRKFPDQIAIYCKQIDIHVYSPDPEEYSRFEKEFEDSGRPADGEYYGIPYGVLVPRGWENLWVAGRCVSTDVRVNGSLRDQPGCMLMGQAAGTAAAQHLNSGQAACDLNTRTLVETLRKHGAYLPQEKLCEVMSRKGFTE